MDVTLQLKSYFQRFNINYYSESEFGKAILTEGGKRIHNFYGARAITAGVY